MDEAFDDLMAMLDPPVFVVTTQAEGQPSGCLVSFATQTSVQPPSFMVGLPIGNPTVAVASRSEHLAVHVLARRQRILAELFARETDEDKFMRCSWRAGPFGMPMLDDAISWLVGRIASRSEVGDHVAYLLEPVSVWSPEVDEDLLYVSDIDEELEPGHEEPQRLYQSQPREATGRSGMRFTLDVP